MPLLSTPSFKTVQSKRLEIAQPCVNGINLTDLEYEQGIGQSPKTINMMYRGGNFCKRYGTEYYQHNELGGKRYTSIIYDGRMFSAIKNSDNTVDIYRDDVNIKQNVGEGHFVIFNRKLYFFGTELLESNSSYGVDASVPYCPVVVINRKPNGTEGNTSEAYNIMGRGFVNKFHGDGSATNFFLTDKNLDIDTPKVNIDNEDWTYDPNLSSAKTFKVDAVNGKITLKSAAPSGTNNVIITAYKHDSEWTELHNQLMKSKYFAAYGGNNDSRLFVAGNGEGKYFYSGVFDATYFPYRSWAKVGNTNEDITGFCHMYSMLMVFKPSEIYGLSYYQATSDTTTSENQVGTGMFSCVRISDEFGCDAPKSIQIINNLPVWFMSKKGVCTLISTNIESEKNVRVISDNVNRSNSLGVMGLLDTPVNTDIKSGTDSVCSADFEGKYILCIGRVADGSNETDYGVCYVWDYNLSPFSVTSSKVTNPSDLSWFMWDGIYADYFINIYDSTTHRNILAYSVTDDHDESSGYATMMKFVDGYHDTDVESGDETAIESVFRTPLYQFEAVEYLKTVKNIYIQCRADTASVIEIKYITEDNPYGETDSEPIRISGRLWKGFTWSSFGWPTVNFGNTYRRKASLKKIQMAGIELSNNEKNRDMSISHIALEYQIVKEVK